MFIWVPEQKQEIESLIDENASLKSTNKLLIAAYSEMEKRLKTLEISMHSEKIPE